MSTYTVTWEIEVDATNERDAARQAQEIMRDPESIATVFLVRDPETGHQRVVDLAVV